MSKWKMGAIAAVLLAGAGPTVVACNLVLGITEAKVDPSLTGSTGTGGSGGGGPKDPCTEYCETIDKNCKGANQEYLSVEVCKLICAPLDPGVEGELTNDSRACRMTHAKLAADDPVTHCQQAGPVAAGSCTTPCSPFCLSASNLCEPLGLFPYDGGVPTCEAACANYKYLVTADAGIPGPVGDLVFSMGNTLNCRIYHLESAYTPDDAGLTVKTHCPHTAVDSATCHD